MKRTFPTLCLVALAAAPAAAQDGARVVEARQVELIQRLSKCVAAVFPGDPGAGGGSGVIIDPRGYVLTNFHVSKLEKRLWVGLNDGKTYPARLLGFDPGGDISLLKLDDPERKTYPFVELGDSDALTLGEPVFAMGNPFLLAEDFSPTVTQGVVSGVHRYRAATGSSDLVYGDCIQIDASINPGNSGGPLFSGRGKLLGINGLGGFRPDRGRVNVGVGFAASINQIKNFLYDLRACRQCYHGTMNATVRDVERPDGRPGSVVIDAITRDSNAYRAGLRLGDQVVAFDGVKVETQNRLLTLISRLPAGRRVTVQVERKREEGAGKHSLSFTFRLEPLWAGPEQGEWQPDEKLIAAETQSILAEVRAAKPALAWEREETVALAGGLKEQRLTRFSGRKVRLERGPAGTQTIAVYDGRAGWLQKPDGSVVDLPPEQRDLLAGTAEALAALFTPGGESRLNRLTFTGGEELAGERVWRLESRDKAGRRRLLYVSPSSKQLVGYAYPAGQGRWVEVQLRADAEGKAYRRDHDSGEVLEVSTQVTRRAAAQDDALFARPQ